MTVRPIAAVAVLACLISGACAPGDSPEPADGTAPSVDTPEDLGRAIGTTDASESSGDAQDRCEALSAEEPQPIVTERTLTEISGATTSSRSTDAVWVHEDSSHPTVLTEIALTGEQRSTWEVPGVEMVDWEDVAAITDADGVRHLFVGDIGDNRARRSHLQILRIPEPLSDERHGTTSPPDVLSLELPDGPADAEALLVDPATADLVILTKSISGAAEVLIAPGAAWAPPGTHLTLESAGTLRLGPGQAVLAGDISPDGTRLGVRTPSRVLLWAHEPGRSPAKTLLDDAPCTAPAPFDIFGEALALLDDGYVLAGEAAAPQLIRVG